MGAIQEDKVFRLVSNLLQTCTLSKRIVSIELLWMTRRICDALKVELKLSVENLSRPLAVTFRITMLYKTTWKYLLYKQYK